MLRNGSIRLHRRCYRALPHTHTQTHTQPHHNTCFGVNAQAEMVRAFDGRDIACRVRVTRGPALLICGGCVNTQPTLTSRVCAGWLSTLPARPSASAFTTGTPVPSSSI